MVIEFEQDIKFSTKMCSFGMQALNGVAFKPFHETLRKSGKEVDSYSSWCVRKTGKDAQFLFMTASERLAFFYPKLSVYP